MDLKASCRCRLLEAGAKLAVRRNSSGNQNVLDSVRGSGAACLAYQGSDHRMLERGDQVKCGAVDQRECSREIRAGRCGESGSKTADGWAHIVCLRITQHGGFDAAEGEIKRRRIDGAAIEFSEAEGHCQSISMGCKAIDPGPAGVGQTEQLCHFVEGLACGIVHGAADVPVVPHTFRLAGQVKMRMAAADDERKHGVSGALHPCLQQHSMDVPLQMVDRDQRLAEAECQSLCKGDPDEESARQAGAGGDGDCIQIGISHGRTSHCLADHWDYAAKVFARGKLRHHATIQGVHVHLRRDHIAEHLAAIAKHRRRGLIAGALNTENQAVAPHAGLLHLTRIVEMADQDWLSPVQATVGFQAALHVVTELRSRGHTAYFAGGCVRDLLMGKQPKDYDVATSARPEKVLLQFPRTFAVGAHFGVVIVCSAHLESGCEVRTEVATYRDDGEYRDGRRPEQVTYAETAEQDVLRRDFTVNGMMLDPVSLQDDLRAHVLDVVGGRADLDAKVLRAIGDPHRRFAEDKLRMLRAVRFAARLDFDIHPETMRAIQQQAATIDQVSSERVRDELTKMLTEGRADRAFALLDESGLLAHVLPEVWRMKGVEQPPEWHPEGDVWVHTRLLLSKLPEGVAPTLAWGALLHDVGKPPCYRAPDLGDPKPRIRFNGHAEVGASMTRAILNRLRFSNEDTDQIVSLVANHMRFGDVKAMKQSTLKRFFRLHDFPEHLQLHWLDVTSSHNLLGMYDYARQHFEAAPAEAHKPALFLTGRDLIAAGLQPGPRFKLLLRDLEDAQLEGTIRNRDEAINLLRDLLHDAPAADAETVHR